MLHVCLYLLLFIGNVTRQRRIYSVYVYAYNPVAYIRMFSIIRNVRRLFQMILCCICSIFLIIRMIPDSKAQ